MTENLDATTSTNNRWSSYVVNLNGFRNGRQGRVTVQPEVIEPERPETANSLPYVVAPSFEMRWPANHNHQFNPAFTLTSHHQLENGANNSQGSSEESPPYLPAIQYNRPAPSAPPPDENFIEKPV